MTFKLAVFGNPIAHSLSPQIHQAFAGQVDIEVDYQKILVQVGDFNTVAGSFLEIGIGFNVTVPFKEDAYQFCDSHSHQALASGTVNTVVRRNKGIEGHNTDGVGIVTDLLNNLRWDPANQRVLIIGAGGAVRGIMADLLETKPASVHLVNRTHEKAEAIAQQFEAQAVTARRPGDLEIGYDLIINASSAGLGGKAPELPETIVGGQTRCYDMVYSREETPFNRWNRSLGALNQADGLGMLVEQAAKAFEIWFERPVQTGPVVEAIRRGA